jgi:hypothetical protein
MPPSDGIPLQDRSRWSRKCPRVPRERSPSLGYVLNVPMVIPRSMSEAAVNPSRASLRTPNQWWARSPSSLRRSLNPSEGPAYEPLTVVGVEPTCSEAAVEPFEGPAFEPLISREARSLVPSQRRILFGVSPFPVPVVRERKRKKENDTKSNDVAYLF